MSEPWELVLHHDYRGVPGVVFDRSPGRGAHGRLKNVAATDFQPDGASAGSGAVRVRGGDAAIRVDLAKPWNVLNGLGVSITCSSDMFNRPGVLIDGANFRIEFIPGNIRGWVECASGRAFSSIVTSEIVPGGWATVGLFYNQGFGIAFDGPTAGGGASSGATSDNLWRGPVKPVSQVAIGSRLEGDFGVAGLIDDVVVTRLDPQQIDRNFRRRPVDDSVRHCWDEWGRNITRLLNEDPKCANEIAAVLANAQNSVSVTVGGPDTQDRAIAAAEAYGQHWVRGELSQIPAEALALANFLKSHGADLAEDRALQQLLNNGCFRRLVQRMPPLTCDPEFTGMIAAIAEGL